ncbi:MAG TPA: tRNA 2-selenouridine(34) synthase MnmH [Flavobacteriales bacterium]|nr:tRNA 2-selenouridine(34) synthase MnmH [Flavobacteriales bacterium]
MVRTLPVEDWLSTDGAIIDVRSPGEFARGHIPGAFNLPLFSNEERTVVGTLYKQRGRDAAMLEGLRIVGPKLAWLVEGSRSIAPHGNIRVHCWRGGERSRSVAWLLDKAGFASVSTLNRGYKGFRNAVLHTFHKDLDLRVLGGFTGTGKTETLHQLELLGQQVIDLEALASHKGSSFGALGEAPQPTTEHFENLLWRAITLLDASKPVWVEDESAMIGRVNIPSAFFSRMRAAILFFVDLPVEERAERLVKVYGRYPVDQLADSVRRIAKRIGPQHCKAALAALETGDLRQVALITLRYYDKSYSYGASQRDPQRVLKISANQHDPASLAQQLIERS